MKRLTAYVDGFNLYYGLRSRGWKRYYWLNMRSLVNRLKNADEEIVATKYFTSRVSATPWDPNKAKRQNTYLEALQTLAGVQIRYGQFLGKPMKCAKCGYRWDSHEEKMTDVNIAVELLTDAYQDRFDVALIISGDSDLTPPIRTIRSLFPHKAVVVGFPPSRNSFELAKAATASFTISRRKLADSQFPDAVTKSDGYVLHRPTTWR